MNAEEGEKYIMDPLIQELTKEQIRDDIPAFRAGDTVTVHVRVVEGTHERIQLFEGVVIKKKGTGIGATYTVRKIASGVGVERTFPVNDTASQQELLKHVVNHNVDIEKLVPNGTSFFVLINIFKVIYI